jgi:hypothetical protein
VNWTESDSGRGLVVTNQAELQMTHSSIVNCAATGFYLGDWCALLVSDHCFVLFTLLTFCLFRGSRARISSSNIVRCGFGDIALQQPTSEEERVTRDEFLSQFTASTRTGHPIPRNQIELVPPGHSGEKGIDVMHLLVHISIFHLI